MAVKEIPLTISDEQANALRVMAIDGYPNEVCGAIYSHNIIVQHCNVHSDPANNYDAEIDLEGAKALWHSHPQGRTEPSANDVRFMELCAAHGLHLHHFIVTPKEVHEYEAISDAAASAA